MSWVVKVVSVDAAVVFIKNGNVSVKKKEVIQKNVSHKSQAHNALL